MCEEKITNQNIFVISNHAILYSYYAKSVTFALARQRSMPIYSKMHQNRMDGSTVILDVVKMTLWWELYVHCWSVSVNSLAQFS